MVYISVFITHITHSKGDSIQKLDTKNQVSECVQFLDGYCAELFCVWFSNGRVIQKPDVSNVLDVIWKADYLVQYSNGNQTGFQTLSGHMTQNGVQKM